MKNSDKKDRSGNKNEQGSEYNKQQARTGSEDMGNRTGSQVDDRSNLNKNQVNDNDDEDETDDDLS
jgi:hypothetical protein